MELVRLLLDIIIILIGLYIVLFKSYFSEKGKNLATKEDISDITSKIETIKNLSSKEQDWFIESKLSLINYYDSYILWTEYSIKRIDIVINNSFFPDKIRRTIDDLNIQHSKVISCIWRLTLYESDEKFINNIKEAYLMAAKLHSLTMDFLIDIETISLKLEKLESLLKDGNSIKTSADKLIEEKSSIIDTFVGKRDKLETNVIELTNKQMNLIRVKIKQKYPAANNDS